MSFYPIFIPMGGGGGGGSPRALLAAYCGAIGLVVYGLHYMHSPTVSLKVKENGGSGNIVTALKHTNYPKIKMVETKNLDCLREKGYSIENNSPYHGSKKDMASLAIAKKGIAKEEFLTDCKECNVRTEVTYTYRGPFWKSRYNKSFEWHKCYKDKVE